MRRALLLAALCLGFSTTSAGAQEATSVRISQAYVDVPDITLFFGARDASGTFVPSVQPKQVSVSAGATDMSVESVTPFSETDRGVAHIFLVDVSKSLRPEQHRRIRTAIDEWIGGFGSEDQGALVTFGSEVDVAKDFTADASALQASVDSLRPSDDFTKLNAGLVQALELGRRRDPDLPKQRAIIVLSDGKDDVRGGMTRGEVRERMRVDRTPIYAIGYARSPVTEEDEKALDALGTLARTSGGQFVEAGAETITETFEDLRERIEEVHVAELSCTACEADGTVRQLRAQLTSGENVMAGGLRVRMQSTIPSGTTTPPDTSAPPDTTAPQDTSNPDGEDSESFVEAASGFFVTLPWWGYGIGALLLVALATGIYLYAWRREDEEPEPAPQPKPKMKTDPEPEPPEPKGTPLHFEAVGRQGGGAYEAHIADRIVVGRSQDCDVVVSGDKEASRQNSEIMREDGELYIRDLDSQNGTLVNGVPISGSYRLEDGDRILIGRTELRIEVPDELQPVR
jgi:Mg-chelatase subunit ChlD